MAGKEEKTVILKGKKVAAKIKAAKSASHKKEKISPNHQYYKALTIANKNRPEIVAMSHFSGQSSRRLDSY